MNETAARYVMNPAEDEIRFSDELAEGMWVLPENARLRGDDDTEDGKIRGQRFRRIIRIRQATAAQSVSDFGVVPAQVAIVTEWIDKYQETWTGAVTSTWLVKKTPGPGDETGLED
jgi:hypothetical protein